MFHGSPVGTCSLSVVGLLGLENQTEIEEDMVLRVISYDGEAYRDQMNRDKKRQAEGALSRSDACPVISVISPRREKCGMCGRLWNC